MAARRGEIERAILNRVHSVSDPTKTGDPAYVNGLRTAVAAGLRYAIAGIETGNPEPEPVPTELFLQARYAARNGVSLDTVLRRYFAAHALLEEFLMQEVERGSLDGMELQRLIRGQATLLDRLVVAITGEYTGAVAGQLRSTEDRRVERIRCLLDGDLLDDPELGYEFDAWHLSMIVAGAGAPQLVRALAAALDRRLLMVRPGGEIVWAWLGGQRRVPADRSLCVARSHLPEGVSLALGESGQGIDGWRVSHRQAAAAFSVALRGGERLLRYADVALVASALNDSVLIDSLRTMYLVPLEKEGDGGAAFRLTLRAYFSANRNVSSAAAMLGLSWPTVKSRLRLIEERIERSLDGCAAEMETALRLHDLEPAGSLASSKFISPVAKLVSVSGPAAKET